MVTDLDTGSVVAAAHVPAVERVIAAMRAGLSEGLSEGLSLHAMAGLVSLSPYHFSRVFRGVTGIPPGEFLAALRLQEAKRLLLTTSLSVTDVCYTVGYGSVGTFTTRFTELVGLPPAQLRRLAQDTVLDLDRLRRGDAAQVKAGAAAADVGGLGGRIDAPDVAGGAIFVGLFPTPIPQSRPLACTILTAPGSYRLAPVPDGHYHVLAAALPLADDPLASLLPGAGLRVGRSDGPVRVAGGSADHSVDVTLRPPRSTDPPFLTALPLLPRSH